MLAKIFFIKQYQQMHRGHSTAPYQLLKRKFLQLSTSCHKLCVTVSVVQVHTLQEPAQS